MDSGKTPPRPKQLNLQIQLDEDIAQGTYVNFAIVNHTPTEFLLDFIFVQPQQPKGKVQARIITSPVHAKRLLLALTENIKRYEQRFGEVKIPSVQPSDPIVH